MTIETIMQKLKLELDAVRYQHSVNVMETSELLARHYGADLNKARLAGILHDCGKNYKGDKAREYIQKIGYEADRVELIQTRLLHGVIGEHLAKTVYEVTDTEVLNAIHWHTTGRPGMTLLEKIIYCADYIEPLRNFQGIENSRKSAFEDLDRCVVDCADSTIRYIVDKGVLLHGKTVETRNYSLMLLKKKIS
ncbi:MAG TPA: phosphohydrolase [Ruminiclostridium sp.]|nr:phosphohydrolase [Ruminiclostridium sp.]